MISKSYSSHLIWHNLIFLVSLFFILFYRISKISVAPQTLEALIVVRAEIKTSTNYWNCYGIIDFYSKSEAQHTHTYTLHRQHRIWEITNHWDFAKCRIEQKKTHTIFTWWIMKCVLLWVLWFTALWMNIQALIRKCISFLHCIVESHSVRVDFSIHIEFEIIQAMNHWTTEQIQGDRIYHSTHQPANPHIHQNN